MLAKLFKHEMRATAKTFMWLYIAFAVIVVVNTVLGGWSPEVETSKPSAEFSVPGAAQVIFATLYVLSILAMGIVTFVVVILRFYRNLLGDEGYLMMTLPVSREKHVLSKLFVALIWTVCTSVMILLSVLMLIAASGEFADMSQAINELITAGVPLGRWIVSFITIVIISSASGILMLYAAMAVGPNLLKNRLGGSILAFIIICVVSQIVTSVVLFTWARSYSGFGVFQTMTETAVITSDAAVGSAIPVVSTLVDIISLGAIISSVIIGVSCWFLTRFMLNRKLNLA